MTRKPSITSLQLMMMAVGSALVFPYTFMPILTTPPANQDIWIDLLLSFVYIVAMNLPLLFLMNRFRGVSINQITELILGKIFGKAAAIFFFLFFFYCQTACSLISVMFIHLYIFPSTPTWALMVYTLVPVCYASYHGAGTIGRLAVTVVPLVIASIVFFFLVGIGDLQPELIKPVMADSSVLQINEGAFLTASRYSEILIFLVFSFYLRREESINRTYTYSLILFCLSFLLILLPMIMILGLDIAKHVWNPYWLYCKQVQAFDFIRKLQSINAIVWFPAAIVKLTMYNYMGSFTLSGAIGVKNHKYFVIPLAVLTLILSEIPFLKQTDIVDFLVSDQFAPWVILPVTFGLPLILFIVYMLRRKKISPQLQKLRSQDTPAQV